MSDAPKARKAKPSLKQRGSEIEMRRSLKACATSQMHHWMRCKGWRATSAPTCCRMRSWQSKVSSVTSSTPISSSPISTTACWKVKWIESSWKWPKLIKDKDDKADKQKIAEKKRKWNVLNPAKMCDPMTRKVFVAQPGILDDLSQAELLGCRVADAEYADFIVETDPADPEDSV